MKNRYAGMLSTTFDGYTEKTFIKEHDSKGSENFLRKIDVTMAEIIANLLVLNKKKVSMSYEGDFAAEIRPLLEAGLKVIEHPEVLDEMNGERIERLINEARREQ